MRADYPWHGSWPSPPEMSVITSFPFFWCWRLLSAPIFAQTKEGGEYSDAQKEGHAENNERLETGAASISWMNGTKESWFFFSCFAVRTKMPTFFCCCCSIFFPSRLLLQHRPVRHGKESVKLLIVTDNESFSRMMSKKAIPESWIHSLFLSY